MSTYSQSQLDAWLERHGYGGREENNTTVDNPAYDEDLPQYGVPKKVTTKEIIWTGKDGAVLKLTSNPEYSTSPDTEPPFIVTGDKGPTQKADDDPNIKRKREIEIADSEQNETERTMNADPTFEGHTGFRETNQEKQLRLEREETRRRSADSEQRAKQAAEDTAYERRVTRERLEAADKIAADEKVYQRGRNAVVDERAIKNDDRLIRNEDRDIETRAHANKISEGNLTLSTRRLEELEIPAAERKQLEDAAKAKRDELTLQIQLHNANAAQAAAEYKQWYDETVDVQLKQVQEARLAAQAELAREQVREQQRQFQSTSALNRAQFGGVEGERAVQTELSLLPYRVGPTFTTEMAAAIEGVATGNASLVKFSPGSFSFNKPDFEGIRKKASKSAIKSVPNYKPANISSPSLPAFTPPDFSTAPRSQPLQLMWPGEPGSEPAWWGQMNQNQPATTVPVE